MARKISGLSHHQLHQELQNELIVTNQLLIAIFEQVEKLKFLTSQKGLLAMNVEKNAEEMELIAKFQNINIKNLPPPIESQTQTIDETNQNSHE